jgi:hypothetical protein
VRPLDEKLLADFKCAAVDIAVDNGVNDVHVVRVLPPPNATFEVRRRARLLEDYLNSPAMRVRISSGAAARTLNTAVYGENPKGWPS